MSTHGRPEENNASPANVCVPDPTPPAAPLNWLWPKAVPISSRATRMLVFMFNFKVLKFGLEVEFPFVFEFCGVANGRFQLIDMFFHITSGQSRLSIKVCMPTLSTACGNRRFAFVPIIVIWTANDKLIDFHTILEASYSDDFHIIVGSRL